MYPIPPVPPRAHAACSPQRLAAAARGGLRRGAGDGPRRQRVRRGRVPRGRLAYSCLGAYKHNKVRTRRRPEAPSPAARQCAACLPTQSPARPLSRPPGPHRPACSQHGPALIRPACSQHGPALIRPACCQRRGIRARKVSVSFRLAGSKRCSAPRGLLALLAWEPAAARSPLRRAGRAGRAAQQLEAVRPIQGRARRPRGHRKLRRKCINTSNGREARLLRNGREARLRCVRNG